MGSERKSLGFKVLSEDQVKRIHSAALEVLERTGVLVQSEEALQLLADAGCKFKGNLVKIPASLAEWAIDRAPSQFLLYDRLGERSLNVGGYNTYFGLGPTLLYMLDLETGERRKFIKSDSEKAARLVDALPNIDWVMGLGTISDCNPEHSDRHEFDVMVRNTTKPLVIWSYTAEGLRDIAELAAAIAGGRDRLAETPFIASFSDPISPLTHDKGATERLLLAADYGIPIIHTPVCQGGASAPVTPAGELVSANAENLSGLVISQLRRKGGPFVIGGVLSIMDMAHAQLAYGAPEMHLLSAAYMDIAHWYGLPTWGTAGCTDSKLADQQAAIEAALSVLFSALSGANLVHDVGYMGSGTMGSLEMIAMVDEIIGMAKHLIQGIKVNEETLALDVIHDVGPGGNFLTANHTLNHFREEFWFPTLMDRLPHDKWRDAGAQTMGNRIKDKARNILETHEPEPLAEGTLEKIREVLSELEPAGKV